jgi:hypothetical protein
MGSVVRLSSIVAIFSITASVAVPLATASADGPRELAQSPFFTSGSTPAPAPVPEPLNVSVSVANNESNPAHVYRASLDNGSGLSYAQCVSFRNVATKIATGVDLSFVVTDSHANVVADFGHEDRGTFTPPVSIDHHCWSGRLWPASVVKRMAHETVRVKDVTFADGTIWKPGMSFVRGYANSAQRLPQPIVESTPNRR